MGCNSSTADGNGLKQVKKGLTQVAPGEDSAFRVTTLPSGQATVSEERDLSWLFKKYDTDGDGTLSAPELQELMKEVQMTVDDPIVNQETFTFPDAQKILAALDHDQNGVVEFCTWIARGLRKNAEEFAYFMSSGPMQRKLATFLLGVKHFLAIKYVEVDNLQAGSINERNLPPPPLVSPPPPATAQSRDQRNVPKFPDTPNDSVDSEPCEESNDEVYSAKEPTSEESTIETPPDTVTEETLNEDMEVKENNEEIADVKETELVPNDGDGEDGI